MDDIRRPNQQRRDFASRQRGYAPRQAPGAPQAQPQHQHLPEQQPYHQPPTQEVYQAPMPQAPTAPQPFYGRPEPDDYLPDLAPAPRDDTPYEHYTQPVPRPQAAPKKSLLPKLPLKYAAAGLAVLILVSASVYMITRPPKKSGFSIAQLAKKSTFGLYYPQPLPNGYSYVTQINAFQNDQAYFMLASGNKHIVFHEQPAGSTTGNNEKIISPQTLTTSVGKATMGVLAGQPAARVTAGSTLISINTTGQVSSAALTQAIQNLKTAR